MWTRVDPRAHTIIGGPHTAHTRVDLYSVGKLIESDVPFRDGSVTDQWVVTGQRRTLSLTVPDTALWARWLALPAVELRPYGGVSFGQGNVDMCPLGVFEVQRRPRNLIPGILNLTAPDRWGARVSPIGFLADLWSRTDLTAARSVGYLIGLASTEWARFPVQYGVVRDTKTPAALWKDKQGVIDDLTKSFAGEAWFDRVGAAVIRNRTYGDPVVTLHPGEGGTLADATADVDLGPVLNRVSVASSNTDVKFAPVHLTILDPNHPAHESRVGIRAKAFTSAGLRDRTDAHRMCRDILRRSSSWARQVSGSMVPDFSLDAGDQAWIQWAPGDRELAGFQQITTPLAEGLQTFTTVKTPEDLDVG